MAKYYIAQSDGSLLPFDGVGLVDNLAIIGASTALTQEESGKTFVVKTDALVITLPTAPADGVTYTFINGGLDGTVALTLAPDVLGSFIGTIANAAADVVASEATDKDWVNTKATANKGDRCTIISEGGTWIITEGVGIWASEA